jgi:hypothetical protein
LQEDIHHVTAGQTALSWSGRPFCMKVEDFCPWPRSGRLVSWQVPAVFGLNDWDRSFLQDLERRFALW